MRIEEKVAQSLINMKKTLAIAESCTGGLLANRLTNIPGSSNFLKFALIAYSNEAKIKLLKVPQEAIRKYGAVSTQVAVSMAQKARKSLKTNFGIGITGIAGPTGGTKAKPIGLTFIAVCTEVETLCLKCHFQGSRKTVKTQAATQALRLLHEFLS
ncbi:MAG: CinA family protein [Candidatus Omnitrophica bacterium]|nr:CinA family protein [Candidatus Omnitrophota bacterium]